MKDYRLYLRDYNISDEEYNVIIDDILNEIAYRTNIWKKEFMFDAINDQIYYDMNAMLQMYEHGEYSTISEYKPDGYDDDTKDYSKSIANILDVRLDSFKYKDLTDEIKNNKNISAIGSDFEYENRFTLKYIGDKLENYEYRRYVTIVSIVPDINQINEARETIISKCLISALQYKVSMFYPDRVDMNYINFLKTNYEYELKQLIDLEPNNGFWQSKRTTNRII